MPIISGGGGSSTTPTLADVIDAGNTAQGDAIFDGDNEEYPRGPGTEAGETGGAAASLYFGTPPSSGTAGAEAHLLGGSGQATARNGGDAILRGGNGVVVLGVSSSAGAYVLAQAGQSTGDNGAVIIKSDNSVGTRGDVLVADGSVLRYDDLGAIKNATHAAPADGVLAAGDLYLWFDQTNGAAKLMVKAKQADGTVVAASVALA